MPIASTGVIASMSTPFLNTLFITEVNSWFNVWLKYNVRAGETNNFSLGRSFF